VNFLGLPGRLTFLLAFTFRQYSAFIAILLFLKKRKDQTSLLVQGTIMRSTFWMLGLLLVLAGAIIAGTSFSAAQNVKCYLPGDSIDPDIFILDVEQNSVRLRDIIKSESRLVVVVIIGGAYLAASDKHGGIWCEDTLDEFPNLKAARNAWKDKGVQFIAIACPPVYSARYGYEKNVFLDQPEESTKFKTAVRQFINKTDSLRKDGTIPFDTLYYDPRLRLLWNESQYKTTPAYGNVYSWQGKFKWHEDTQTYGTPSIWFLDERGKILRKPLYGNSYGSMPPTIRYTYWELDAAIGELLSAQAGNP
jgi:hypothetical protein